MNRVIEEAPPAGDDSLVLRTPPWLVLLLRAAFAAMAAALAVLAFREWVGMPWGFRGLVLVLVPAFLYFAAWSGAWKGTIRFVADGQGIYFPCNALVIHKVGAPSSSRWLWVPWSHVSNIRIAFEFDCEGNTCRCVAFDLVVTSWERSEFFRHVGQPTDREHDDPGRLAIAYSDSPPFPRTTVARLVAMQRRYRE